MTNQDQILAVYQKRPKKLVFKIFIVVVIVVVFVWSLPPLQSFIISDSGLSIAKNMLNSFIRPNLDKLLSLKEYGVPYLMFETIMIAVMGTVLGSLLSIPIAFMASENISNKIFNILAKVLIVLVRSLPFFVVGLIFIRAVGPSKFAGVLTVAFSSIGMLSKLFTESIEDIQKGIIEALDSIGANTPQKIRFGYVPQLTGNFLSQILYRFDLNVRNAIILGLIGAGRLGFELNAAIGNFRYKDVAAYLWAIIIVVLVVEIASTSLRKRIIYGKKN